MTGLPETTPLKRSVTRAESSETLRAFFCLALVLCSLPLYLEPGGGALRAAAPGMDAPPPPTLESGHRFGVSGLERRVWNVPSVTGRLRLPTWAQLVTPLRPPTPDAAPTELAEQQQWQLEGG